jgi:hypothetical protein
MKTLTFAIEDELYRKAESEAARRQTTVDVLAREALQALTEGRPLSRAEEEAEQQQRLRLVDLLEQCQIDLTERPTREATYAHRRFH